MKHTLELTEPQVFWVLRVLEGRLNGTDPWPGRRSVAATLRKLRALTALPEKPEERFTK